MSTETPNRIPAQLSPDTHEQFREFCEAHDMTSDQATKFLLTIVESWINGEVSALDPSIQEYQDMVPKVSGSESSIDGYLVSNSSESIFVGTGMQDSVVISSAQQSQDKTFSPATESTVENGIVYCPVCGTDQLTYSKGASGLRPFGDHFQDATISCGDCQTPRPLYSLYVVEQGAIFPKAAAREHLKRYLGKVLIGGQCEFEEFKRRFRYAREVADELDWDWLFEPGLWVDYEYDGDFEIAPQDYLRFFAGVVSVLYTESSGDRLKSSNFEYRKEERGGEVCVVFDGSHQSFTDAVADVTTDWTDVSCEWSVEDRGSETQVIWMITGL